MPDNSFDIPDWESVVHHEDSMFFEPGGLGRFVKAIDAFAGKATVENKNRVVLNEYRLGECHFRASQTLRFHKTSNCSIYKEMAHLAFWLAKLKPLRFESPRATLGVTLMEGFRKLQTGPWSLLEDQATDLETEFQKLLQMPINESIAISLLLDCIEAQQLEFASDELSGKKKRKFNQFIKHNKKRRLWFHHKMMKSLRDHNYSIRGLAVLVETTFKSPFEAKHDMKNSKVG